MDKRVEELIGRIRQSICLGMSKEAIVGHFVDAESGVSHEDVFLAYMAATIMIDNTISERS